MLADIIIKNSLKFGEFVLSSGKKSNYYIDLSKTIFTPMGLTTIVDAIMARDLPVVQAIGGPADGAISLVAGLMSRGLAWRGFYIRREAKNKDLIEGQLEVGDNVLLIDDVTTTGKSIERSIEVIEAYGAKVVHILTIVDRGEYKSKLPFTALISYAELLAGKV